MLAWIGLVSDLEVLEQGRIHAIQHDRYDPAVRDDAETFSGKLGQVLDHRADGRAQPVDVTHLVQVDFSIPERMLTRFISHVLP